LRDAYPDDVEAAIFLARTLVANSPPTDMTFERNLQAAEILEPLFAEYPNHPGIAHYLIHAYDAPPIAERGLDAARRYASIAPAAPHALHMPSHIFTRVGEWDASIETNARSAAVETPAAISHPHDYMVYAFLQQGRDAEARALVAEAVAVPDRFYGGIIGYNATAMPARYALERDRWAEAAALEIPTGALPFVEAVARFARTIGAARSGRPAAARHDVDALDALELELRRSGDQDWVARVGAQRLAAEAWVVYAEGDIEEALRLARAAADLEDTVEKHPVTPGPLLPARELLGDLLLELDRPADALVEYEATLVQEPNRARTTFGAARAAEAAGELESARDHYRALLTLMERADPERPEPRLARAFLGR
jgi:tetratricopeptide (TPR) repeat protein